MDYQKYDLPDVTGPTTVTIGVDIKDIPKVEHLLRQHISQLSYVIDGTWHPSQS
jgi:hypothetical protein